MIRSYLFKEGRVQEDVRLDDWRSLVAEECALLWVDVRGFDGEEMETLATRFGLHSLAVESCLNRYRRPHLYEFEDHFYVNVTTVRKSRRGGIQPGELHVFVGERFVITVSKERDSTAVDATLEEIRDHPAACSRGSIYVFYQLMEYLVETYYPVVENLDSRADGLEEELLERADRESLKRLFALKRSTFELRKFLGPQRDMFNELARRDFPFIAGENRVYLQDLFSRMIRLFDMLDTVREILSGNLDIYLSNVSNRLNQVMKVLTVVATLLMTLSFITGFYGMNFACLPWLESPNAFRNIVILMLALTVGMLLWFRRKKWI